jgi:hypothetical protein
MQSCPPVFAYAQRGQTIVAPRATGHVIGTIGSAPRNVRSLPLRPVRASPVALPQSPTASVLMTGCRTSATWYAMPSQRSIGASPAPANAFRQVSPTRLHGLIG